MLKIFYTDKLMGFNPLRYSIRLRLHPGKIPGSAPDEAVLNPTGPDPFRWATGGVPAYEYYGTDPQSGFDGVERLVDVGGSSGACLEMIMKQVPSVKSGVNFDLPEVVAAAPEIPGESFAGSIYILLGCYYNHFKLHVIYWF
jgi:O-methyltransferase domain